MLAFILKRIGLALITLWILSVIVFLPARCCPAIRAGRSSGPLSAQSAVTALDHQLGVDKPLITQYWDWITQSSRASLVPATRRRSGRS